MSRRVAYISGTRADFGLMQSTLRLIQDCQELELGILVTGMHLDSRYGSTVGEIEASGLPIVARIFVSDGPSDGASMARNIAQMLTGFVDALQKFAPDILVVLGDRGEMLAAAIAGTHLSIPVVHIHGGERSGTIDESVRHAVSKLAHIHLAATAESRRRLIQMGEEPAKVHVVGAPGLDGLAQLAEPDKASIFTALGLDADRETALLLYHPVLQEAAQAGDQVEAVIDALLAVDISVIALRPNSDAGNMPILSVLERYAEDRRITLVTHLQRHHFATLLRHVDLMVGNSSSGIIEAATFGTPVVNIGSRQNLRQRNSNVIDTPAESEAILAAVDRARKQERAGVTNVYGDGNAGARIVSIIKHLDISGGLLNKANAY